MNTTKNVLFEMFIVPLGHNRVEAVSGKFKLQVDKSSAVWANDQKNIESLGLAEY